MSKLFTCAKITLRSDNEEKWNLQLVYHSSPLFKEIDVVDERVKDLNLFNALYLMVKTDIINRIKLLHINKVLKTDYHLSRGIRKQIVLFMSKKAALIRRKNSLSTSHRLLRYWHVLHVPLAIVMFIIMFGNKKLSYLRQEHIMAQPSTDRQTDRQTDRHVLTAVMCIVGAYGYTPLRVPKSEIAFSKC